MPDQKKILINASTVKYSGGLIVGIDIIDALIQSEEFNILLICPKISEYYKFRNATKVTFVPELLLSYFLRPLLDFIWLPKRIFKFNADIVVSLGNLPAVFRGKQVFFHDNAFVSGNYDHLLKHNITSRIIHQVRKNFFRRRLRYVQKIIVQTQLEKEKMIKYIPATIKVHVVPPLLISHLKGKSNQSTGIGAKEDYKHILCLSRYYHHKNIGAVYDAAAICYQNNLPFRFYVTIGSDQGKGARSLIRKIQNNNLGNHIVNLGEIQRNMIPALIAECDAMLLPSLVETYGLNCIEAWYFAKPIYIADRPYAHHVCGHAALYFDPYNANDLVNRIETSINEEHMLNELINAGRKKLEELALPKDIVHEINEVTS